MGTERWGQGNNELSEKTVEKERKKISK